MPHILPTGCYQEVRCIAPEGVDVVAPPFDQPGESRDYLLLGFKTVDESFSQVGALGSALGHSAVLPPRYY